MITWEQNIKYYTQTFDVMHEYLNTKTKDVALDTVLKNVSVQMAEKLHINMIMCLDLLPMVADKPMKFLPYGLVLRGIVSDLINYRYLRQVLDVAGKDVFENEVKILDLDFVSAYKAVVESEKKLGGADDEMKKTMDAKLKETFTGFYDGNSLIKEKDLRTDAMMKPLRDFIDSKLEDKNINLGSEAGKLKFIVDNNIEQLKIAYKYLSQLQHFSSRSYTFYKLKEYQDFNPHFSLLVLFVIITALVPIFKDLAPDEKTIEILVGYATEISKLTE